MDEYLNRVPREIRRLFETLGDKTRLAIAIAVLEHGKLSFSNLQERLGLDSNKLAHHLRVLTQAALLNNYHLRSKESSDYSYYTSSESLQQSFISLMSEPASPKTAQRPPKTVTMSLRDVVFEKAWSRLEVPSLVEVMSWPKWSRDLGRGFLIVFPITQRESHPPGIHRPIDLERHETYPRPLGPNLPAFAPEFGGS